MAFSKYRLSFPNDQLPMTKILEDEKRRMKEKKKRGASKSVRIWHWAENSSDKDDS